MWTDTTRKQFARDGLRLPSDLTDAEWAVLEPLFGPRRSGAGRDFGDGLVLLRPGGVKPDHGG